MSAGELTNAAFKARTTQMSKHWEVYGLNQRFFFTLKYIFASKGGIVLLGVCSFLLKQELKQ